VLEDVLLNLHRDLGDYLRLDPAITAPVIDSRTLEEEGEGGNIQDLIEAALSEAGALNKNGLSGLAVVVLMPDVDTESDTAPGPMINIVLGVRIFENRTLNESASGFQISASRLAVHIARSLHLWSPRGNAALYPARRLIQDIGLPDTEGHEVTFTMQLNLPPPDRASQPSITAVEQDDDALITLATATSGASIYYTLDGRLPGPDTGTLYTAPFLVTETGLLRAIAIATDLLPSNTAEATITIV
jgi:hypothetical protein